MSQENGHIYELDTSDPDPCKWRWKFTNGSRSHDVSEKGLESYFRRRNSKLQRELSKG